jgi:predicted RNase H-like nuclease
MQRVAGIDGCRTGWLVVESSLNLKEQSWRIAPNWNAIGSDAQVIAVDMPIGISGSGVRQCEVEARSILTPFASRVFKTLPRGALRFAQKDWALANQWAKDQNCGGISKQIWNIRPKMIEIDRAITPGMQKRIFEAHPELAFARLNGGRALVSKHSGAGLKLRKQMLVRAGFVKLGEWLQNLRGSGAKADDLLDACALVLTARHILRGKAQMLPLRAERDPRGLRMAIAY